MENNKNYNELPNINDENELEYWAEFRKTSSPKIREALIKKYAPLAKNEANKIKANTKIGNIIDFVDFESFGFLGLSDAIGGYDPNQEIKFKTYAIVKIQGAIYEELKKLHYKLKSDIASDLKMDDIENIQFFIKSLNKLSEKEYKVLILYYYKNLTLEEICKITDMSQIEVEELRQKAIQDLRHILYEIKKIK